MKPAFLLAFLLAAALPAPAGQVSKYNVVWDAPSRDHTGSMPLGNGDLGLNAWIEPSGDLVFLISKTDAWDDNARLVKVGQVRVKCDPPLWREGERFRQTLDLAAGTMTVEVEGGRGKRELALWVDANRPVVQVQVSGSAELTATAAVESWRTAPYELPSIEASDVMTDRSKPKSMHEPMVVEPDTTMNEAECRALAGAGETALVGWFHHNRKSVGPSLHAQVQGMAECPRPEPLLGRTFGVVMAAEGGTRLDDTHLRTKPGRTLRFTLVVRTEHPSSPGQWQANTAKMLAECGETGFEQRRRDHEAWWKEFWNRSWIEATTNGSKPAPAGRNHHPVRVGADQEGGNRFGGTIGRLSVARQAWPESKIAALAKDDRQALAGTTVALSRTEVAAGTDLPGVEAGALTNGFSIEAWIRPATDASARILDNITPGGADGVLLDIQPGRTLRFINGPSTLKAEGCLKPGQWQQVAATVDDHGKAMLFLDGRVVARSGEADADGDEAFVVSRAYALQRFVTACAGRGRYPIKFNGSIFTVPAGANPGYADYRRWGPGYWWQNTRLPYLGMCAAGDFEMMEPLFRLYVDELLPVNCYRTRKYFGFENAAYYPECVHFWGDVFNESYGWQPVSERKDPLQVAGWHKWEWVGGLELVCFLLDAYDHTGDRKMLEARLLPAARAVTRFFDAYYKTNEQGKLVMHPSQALETWWNCTNPMPEVAGLHAVCDRLLGIPPDRVPEADRRFWESLRAKLPDLPTREVKGRRAWAPAESFADKRNVENPELYCVFPFRLCSFEKPNRALGLAALENLWDDGHAGWRQNDLFMSYLGLADRTREAIVQRSRNHDRGSRFPAFWGPNYDWIPDQDHGGVLVRTLQTMVLQTDPYSRKMFLLPAWPRSWDCEFKLHAPYDTTVEGRVRAGKVEALKVTPESRRADLTVVGAG